ncbi:MAG: glycosyltransferase [Planctomycetota bacterium]
MSADRDPATGAGGPARADDAAPPSPALTLVIPVYQGAAFLADTLRELEAWLAGRPAPTELIFVDDGSRDDGAARIEAALDRLPGARLLRSPRNCGKGHAVRQGVLASRGAQVAFTDADLAYPPEQVEVLLAALDRGADVAIADRSAPGSRVTLGADVLVYVWRRHLASRVFNRLTRLLLGIPYRDTQAGLKAFRGDVARALFQELELDGFAFDLELLALAHRRGLRVAEVPVVYRHLSEASTIHLGQDARHLLQDALEVRRRLGPPP